MDWLELVWPLAAAAISLLMVSHAVVNKRDVRSAAGWTALIMLLPGLGAMLYLILGINRIARAGDRLRGGMQRYEHPTPRTIASADLARGLALEDAHLASIARTIERTSRWPLLPGNQVQVLRDGDQAYPEMLRAIDGARASIALGTYIFDSDPVGQRFVEALARAQGRGVVVRVLLDDAGARYSFPSIDGALRKRGIRVARFLPVFWPWSVAFANLRNHRKVLVVDGAIGFTGGMNIRQGCVLAESPRHPTRDLHFRLDGPVVTQLLDVFAEDWTFATKEVLDGDAWFPKVDTAGETHARAVSDGPDRDLDCIRWALHGAIGTARRTIRIVTPYFLPDEPLITALNAAALRGVQVDLVLPERTNLRLVTWAMRGELWKVLHHGCRVFLGPPPFDHAKLMTVDHAWSLIGTSNWDPRSLRLNFELGVECYDRELARRLDHVIDERVASARPFHAADFMGASRLVRLRDGAARLLSPYL
ncbi:MAG: PLDc N-terminal domain-containing protein [Polyangiaceae bacterium]|jgi:cardiolipin synthase|nr:PLDc N-terminal domain-containing protein [Polyangiaceae bacterium]MBK8938481.1 PLDc N-terminal domain-containing protein [Polyangiaceae bacterium]